MNNFTYHAPTNVIFGRNTHKQVGDIIKGYGYDRIMLQYGKNSIKASGLYDEIMQSLRDSGITVVEMGGVQPNPTVEFVRSAIAVAREHKVQLVLAVGGGSVIDSAKCTAVGVPYEGDEWDFHCGKATPKAALPVGCVLTLAAAGSEMSASAVLTNTELNSKRGFGSQFNRCLFSICNPELTYTVSPYQTACGIVDSMAHTMERYFTVCPPTDLTDQMAEGVLRALINAGRTLLTDPQNYEARANMMWGSSLSHNGLTGCFREQALAVHQLEHALSGEYEHIAHGAGLAVLFPAWARYIYPHNIPRFAQFARRVWEVTEADDKVAAEEGIRRMADYFAELGMPTRLRDFAIPESCIPRLAELCSFGRTRAVKSYIPMDYNVVKDIFEACY
ncbi:MAG: iron-containing alcohol dehydrogenase [Clostridia bacterium]|nr:iron-containing alcohol dehydrogenase [Clostridia bacterium]